MFKPILFVFFCVLSVALSESDSAHMETFKKLVANFCGPDVPADKTKIVMDCDQGFPTIVSHRIKSVFK